MLAPPFHTPQAQAHDPHVKSNLLHTGQICIRRIHLDIFQYRTQAARCSDKLEPRLLQRDGLGPRIVVRCPGCRSPPSTVNSEMCVVHHRVFDQEETGVGDLLRLGNPSGEDATRFELPLEIGLRCELNNSFRHTSRSGPMRAEATTAGDTELIRMPDGPRKSAIASVMPSTAADISTRRNPFYPLFEGP